MQGMVIYNNKKHYSAAQGSQFLLIYDMSVFSALTVE